MDDTFLHSYKLCIPTLFARQLYTSNQPSSFWLLSICMRILDQDGDIAAAHL
jgi:hypothetical protein